MGHRELFAEFIKELNTEDVNYLILRGFARLPQSPDSDIDLVCHPDDWVKFNAIASKHLSKDPREPFENYGFAEYCDMLYHPYFTPGPKDHSISNGCFRVDSYNSIYFSTPFTGFKTFWTIPHDLSERVFAEKLTKNSGMYDYHIPSPEHEVTLLILRSLLDVIGWKRKACKQKHKNRVSVLLPNCNEGKLISEIKCVLPRPEFVLENVKRGEYKKLYNEIIGGFNNGANRR